MNAPRLLLACFSLVSLSSCVVASKNLFSSEEGGDTSRKEDASSSSSCIEKNCSGEIDKDTWDKEFANLSNFTLKIGEGRNDVLEGKIISSELIQTMDDSGSVSKKENGKWYSYTYDGFTDTWNKVSTNSQDELIKVCVFFLSFEGYYEQFVYEEAGKEYTCPSLKKSHFEGEKVNIEQNDIHVSFKNGRLSSISLRSQIDFDSETKTSISARDIGETELVLPSTAPLRDVNEVDLGSWNEAFENLDNFTMTATQDGNKSSIKVMENALEISYEMSDGSKGINGLYVKEEGQWYSYSLDQEKNAWSKNKTGDIEDQISLYTALISYEGEDYYRQFTYRSDRYSCASLAKKMPSPMNWTLTQTNLVVAFFSGSIMEISGTTQPNPNDPSFPFVVSSIGNTDISFPNV